MKTLTVSEAARDLASVLKQAVAGEEIGIRSENTVVALHPIVPANRTHGNVSAREALKSLQRDAHLTANEAEAYLREIRAERLAAENRGRA